MKRLFVCFDCEETFIEDESEANVISWDKSQSYCKDCWVVNKKYYRNIDENNRSRKNNVVPIR